MRFPVPSRNRLADLVFVCWALGPPLTFGAVYVTSATGPLGAGTIDVSLSSWPPARLAEFGSAALRSLLMAGGVATLGTLTGWRLSEDVALRPHRFKRLILLGPVFIAGPVLGVGLGFVFLSLPLNSPLVAVLCSHYVVVAALAAILLRGAWSDELRALGEVARGLGATPAVEWFSVYGPIQLRAIVTTWFVVFAYSWTQYSLTLLVGRGQVETLPLLAYAALTEANRPLAAAAALALIAPPLAVAFAALRLDGSEPKPC